MNGTCTMILEKNMVEIKVCVYNIKNFPKGDHQIDSTRVTKVNLHFSTTIEFQCDIKMNRYVMVSIPHGYFLANLLPWA
jgi:hypothetical protein